MAARRSAGLLLFRHGPQGLEVLLGHMGGPLWARKDAGAWTVPKGEIDDGEEPYAAALREFAEEFGSPPPASETPDLDLGSVRQRGGKVVVAWARDADVDPRGIASNTFTMEWPPRSGTLREFPELDRAAWFPLDAAREVVVSAQAALLDRLEEALSDQARRMSASP